MPSPGDAGYLNKLFAIPGAVSPGQLPTTADETRTTKN
jgi:hypothetical protein